MPRMSPRSRAKTPVFQWLAILFLISSLVVAPWLLGGRPAWAQFALAIPLTLSAICTVLAAANGLRLGRISRLAWCGGAVVALGILQLAVPASSSFARLNHVILRDYIPDAASAASEMIPQVHDVWSCDPAGTWAALPLYCMAMAVFILASLLSIRTGFVRLFLYAITVNGCVLAVFGMYQKMRWDNVPFGFMVPEYGGHPYASFINRNNAAAYLLLCFAAGLSLYLRLREANERRRGNSWKKDRDEETSWIAIGCLGAISAGIVATLSRSGVISLVSGVLIVAPLILRSRNSVVTAATGLAIWFVAVSMAGWYSDSMERFLEIGEITLQTGRIDHWQHTAPAIYDFLWFGSGLGTYSAVNRPYQTTTLWFVHADNQYVELALELGLIGIGLLIVLLLGLSDHVRNLFRTSRQQEIGESIAVLLLFALVSQMVHAFFDFGIIASASTLTAAALLGIATSRSLYYPSLNHAHERSRKRTRRTRGHSPQRAALGYGVLATGLLIAAIGVLRTTMPVELIAAGTRKLERQRPNDEELASKGILFGEIASHQNSHPPRPEDVHSAASLIEREFRTRLAESLSPDSGRISQRSWELSNPVQLLLSTIGNSELETQLQEAINREGLRTLLIEEEQLTLKAIELAPLSGADWKRLATTRWLLSDSSSTTLGAAELAAMLRPFDEDTVLIYAMLLADSGDHARAISFYRFLGTLPETDWEMIWASARRFYTPRLIANEIISTNVSVQIALFEQLNDADELRELSSHVLDHYTNTNIPSAPQHRSPEDNYLYGIAAAHLGHTDLAVQQLKAAVNDRPLQVTWRIKLSELLLDQGNTAFAREQLEQASRLAPSDHTIEELYRRSLASPTYDTTGNY